MRRILGILFLLPLALFGQQEFAIKGDVKGLTEGSAISLTDANNPKDTLASSRIENGGFELRGSVPEPNLYQLNFDGIQKKSIVFLSNHALSVKGDAQAVQNLEITGSPTHDVFTEFQQVFNPLFQELTRLSQQINSQGMQRDESLMNDYRKQAGKISAAVNDFVTRHRSSPVSPFLLVVTSQLEQDISVTESRFGLLDEKIKNGFYGKIVGEYIAEARIGAVGAQALDFSQADPDGKMVSLSAFRGKYLLVDFWASWCRPCRMENPNLVKAYHRFKDKNFTVLGVSLDRSKDSWLKAIKDDKLDWTQVSDLKFWSNEAAVKYKVQSIPQNLLIDPSGKIIAKNLRGPELHSKLCELLGCN